MRGLFFAAVLVTAACNGLAGIEPAIFDRCLDHPDAPACADAGSGGSAGATSSATSATSAISGTTSVCGDGRIDAGEECDDGNGVAGDGCTGCIVDCAPPAVKDPQSNHCYWIEDDHHGSWSAAETYCNGIGAYLATLTSEAEASFIRGEAGNVELWISGKLIGPSQFGWSNGESWTYEPWKDDEEPTDPKKACVKFKEGVFEGEECDKEHGFLCERSPLGVAP